MNTTEFVAQALSLMYLSLGVGMFINPKYYWKKFKTMFNDAGLTFSLAIITLFAGLAIVKLHGEWTSDFEVAITIVGWGALIKGMLLLMFPNLMLNIAHSIFSRKSWLRFMTLLMFALGMLFGYIGFFLN